VIQPFSLPKVFSDLANDPRWPEQLMKLADQIAGDIPIESKILRQLKLDKARLALMVVEEGAKRYSNCSGWMETSSGAASKMKDIFKALNEWGINPDHYGKVKERVENPDK